MTALPPHNGDNIMLPWTEEQLKEWTATVLRARWPDVKRRCVRLLVWFDEASGLWQHQVDSAANEYSLPTYFDTLTDGGWSNTDKSHATMMMDTETLYEGRHDQVAADMAGWIFAQAQKKGG